MAELIYSKVIPGKLLHIINRFLGVKEGREDLVPSHNFIQMATIKLGEFQTFKPHKHKWKNVADIAQIAQESWVVLRGTVKVTLYDIDDKVLRDDIVLYPLDCSITLEGGHNYTSLDGNTVVYEYKNGPYLGQESDKEFI